MRFAPIIAFALAAVAASASAATLTVNGTDDIFAAGLGVAPVSAGGGGTLPSFVTVTPGQTVVVTATGTINCCAPGTSMLSGPDGFTPNPFGGGGSTITNSTGSVVGTYTDATGAFSLAGVFLGGATATPFEIGSGGSFVVPIGATRLYFGIPDASGFNGSSGFYADNTGAFTVTVGVPEPMTWGLMVAGLGIVGAAARRRRAIVTA